jgi:Uma2 family endonuclease
MGMAAPIYWTAEQVRQLPEDGNRYEVVYGELLVTPAPRLSHQLLVTRLGNALFNYLESEPVGVLLTAPADVSWGRPDVLVQPDVFVTTREQVRTDDWTRIRDLLLVVEVLSPSSLRADRFTKRRAYQEQAVPLYWVVDGEARQVEVWRLNAEFPVIAREQLEWQPAGATRPLTLALAELFRPV